MIKNFKILLLIIAFPLLGWSQTTVVSEGTDSLMFLTNGSKSMVVSPNGKIRIGTIKNTNASAILQLNSTTGGLLIPRMTTAQRGAIAVPVKGLLIYNTDNSRFESYDGVSAWENILTNSTGQDVLSDNDNDTRIEVEQSADEDFIRFTANSTEAMTIDNIGKVGINNTSPNAPLDINGKVIQNTTISAGSGSANISRVNNIYLSAGTQSGALRAVDNIVNISTAAVTSGDVSTSTEVSANRNVVSVTSSGTTNQLFGAVNAVSTSGAIGGNTDSYGTLNMVSHGATSGTISNAIGSSSIVENSGGGALTSAMGHTISVQNTGVGTITNAYGLFIGNINTATTTNVALLTNAGLVRFNDGADANSHFNVKSSGNSNMFFVDAANDKVGIGTNTPTTTLDITSDGGSILIPRKSTAGDPTGINGMIYYNANLGKFRVYENGAWKDWVFEAGTAPWSYSSPNVYLTTLSDFVGIGTNSPGYNLDVQSTANSMLNISSSASATNTMAGLRLSMYDSYVGTHYNVYAEKDDGTPNSGSSDFIMRKDFSTGGGYLKFFRYINSTNDVVINDSKTTGSAFGNFVVANGNVGVGTFSPAEILDVQGRVFMAQTTAPGATADRLYNVGGNLFWNGTQLGVSSSLRDADNNTKVEVEQSANEDKIRLSTAGVERMIIDASGNVGIGTSSPIFNFHLNYNAGSYNVIQTSSETGNATLALSRTRGSSAAPTAVFSGDKLGELTFLGHDGTSYTESAMIQVLASENHGVSMAGGELRFRTTLNGMTSSNDRMIITNDGKVGIGTVSPDEKLHVAHNQDIHKHTIYGAASQLTSSSDYYNVGVTGFASSDANAYGFGTGVLGVAKPSVAAGAGLYGAIGVYAGLNSTVPNVGFGGTHYALYVDAGSDAVTKYAGVFMNGNVGVGTSTPSTARLQVEESTTIEGIRINNSGTNIGAGFYNTNSSNTSDVITISTNGQNSKGLSVSHTGIGGAGTDYSIYATNTGATGSTANVAGYFSASGATNNYAAIFDQGSVGIGTNTPETKLHIGGDAELRVGDATATAAQKITMYTPGAGFTQIIEGGGDNNSLGLQATSSSGTAIYIKTKNAVAAQTDRLTFSSGATTTNALFTGVNVGINEATPGSPLVVKGLGSGSGTSSFHVLNSGGTSVLFVRDDGNIGIGTSTPTTNTRLAIKDGHLQAQQTAAPTIAAGAALGSANVSLASATDVAGKLGFNPGATATAGAMATITFNKTYAVAPIVILTPANNMAAQGAAGKQVYVGSSTTSGFTVTYFVDPNNAPDLSGAYHYYYYYVIETQ